MIEQIDLKKQQLDAKSPLPKYTVQSLREKLFLEWTYNSNAIEGNTLTINETKVVLEGITVGGKTMREHLEVINHRDAISYVEEVVHKEEPFSEWQIKNLHRLILKGIDDGYAGVYRDQQVFISGTIHTPPPPFKIQEQGQGPRGERHSRQKKKRGLSGLSRPPARTFSSYCVTTTYHI